MSLSLATAGQSAASAAHRRLQSWQILGYCPRAASVAAPRARTARGRWTARRSAATVQRMAVRVGVARGVRTGGAG